MRNRGLAFRLAFFILSSCVAIFTVIFVYDYRVSRRILFKEIKENAINLARVTVNGIETVLESVEKVPESIASTLEYAKYDEKGLLKLLRSMVENNPEVYGATIAFESGGAGTDAGRFAPYFYRSDGGIKYSNLAEADYRYTEWDWYRIPKESRRPLWSEPYYDEGGGNVVMSTYSVPFYKDIDGKREFRGIVTADIYLSWLQDIVSSIKIGETGYAFLISSRGTVVTHPDRSLIMRETLFHLAEARGNARIREIGEEMIGGNSGFVPCESIVTGKECWIAYAPIPSTAWSLGVLYPRDELLADVTNLRKSVLVLGVAGVLFLLVVIVFISGSITRPLRMLARKTRDIARGNLDFDLPARLSGDEVGRLANSFLFMRDSLKRYIRDLKETTASKERIESELRLAREMQQGILPRDFPPLPGMETVEIVARMEPAMEVGGDFYDFFPVGDDRLGVVMADVSGKGAPAGLFMMQARAFLRSSAAGVSSPAAVIEKVNRLVCAHNPASDFVTLIYLVINRRTGEATFCNAGHPPPVLLKGARAVLLTLERKQIAVGVREEAKYTEERLKLASGESVVLYTDGVTEAMNPRGEMFGEEGLLGVLEKGSDSPNGETCEGLFQRLLAHREGTEQNDDTTVLFFRFSVAGQNAGSLKKA